MRKNSVYRRYSYKSPYSKTYSIQPVSSTYDPDTDTHLMARYDFINPAVTNQLTDRSGNGLHGTFGSGGLFRPTQGTAGVNFGGTSIQCIELPPSIHASYAAFAIVLDVEPMDQHDVVVIWSSNSNNACLTLNANGDIGFIHGDYQQARDLSSATNVKGRVILSGNVGVNPSLYINGEEVPGYLAKTVIQQESATGFWLGSYVGAAGGTYKGNMNYLMFFDAHKTASGHRSVAAFINTELIARGLALTDHYAEAEAGYLGRNEHSENVPAPITPFDGVRPTGYFDGDSIISGSVDDFAASIPFYTLQSMEDDSRIVNAAVWGTTSTAMLARLPQFINSIKRCADSGSATFVAPAIGTNDFTQGQTAAAVFARVQQYAAAVKAANASIIVIASTVIDTRDGTTDAAVRAAYNTLVRDNTDPNIDTYCDYQFASGLIFDDYADNYHPNPDGLRKMANVMVAKLITLGFNASTLQATNRTLKVLLSPRTCFKDNAGTLPAQDGEKFAVLRDIWRNRGHFFQTDTNKQFTLRLDAGRKRYYAEATSSGLGMSSSIAIPSTCTLGFSAFQTNTGATRIVQPNALNGLISGRRSGLVFFMGSPTIVTTAPVANSSRHTFIASRTTNWELYVDGGGNLAIANNATPWGNGVSIGGAAGSDGFTECWQGGFHGIVAFAENLTGTPKANLKSYLDSL